MKILFIGDIFAKAGRKAIAEFLPKLIIDEQIDLVIANAENCTHGRSLNSRHYKYLKLLGVDVFTFGNHTWDNGVLYEIINNNDIVRPLNIKQNTKEGKEGVGSRVVEVKNKKIRITNLLGISASCRGLQTNPFLEMEKLLEQTNDKQDIHIVDFHANATSEKNAFLAAFVGRISALVGTHTHVQTADEKIYKNTAYITDVGMTGPSEGIIGASPKTIIQMYKEEVEHFKLDPDTSNGQLNAVIITFDDKTNQPIFIERVNKIIKS